MTKTEEADLDCEIWRDIEGYIGLYQVSNRGNVKSMARSVKVRSNGSKYNKSRILKQNNTRGYTQVGLSKKGNAKSYRIHRLVANAFIENPDQKKEVNHINEIRNDNRVENLEWCTRIENAHHTINRSPHKKKTWRTSEHSKLDIPKILTAITLDGHMQRKKIAEAFNVPSMVISNLLVGRTYGNEFKYIIKQINKCYYTKKVN